MQAVTTVALLARKDGLSSELFSRYWRDVHGALAARIPGFESYIQHHLGDAVRLSPSGQESTVIDDGARFDGFAEVGFRNDGERAGLATSEVAALIQDDEQNVFKTTLLYNLAPGASRTLWSGAAGTDLRQASSCFLLLGRRPGTTNAALVAAVEQSLVPALSQQAGVLTLRLHELASGDPSLWVTAGVDHAQTPATSFDAVLQIVGLAPSKSVAALQAALAAASARLVGVLGQLDLYHATASYVMVEHGRPTPLALRGLDVMQTIEATGARNQLGDAVLRCLYGITAADAWQR